MELSPEQVVAAEACGVAFIPATEDQVARLAMQRRVFKTGSRPVLATRGGSFYETAATLAPLIAEGERRLADLAARERTSGPPAAGDAADPAAAASCIADPEAVAAPSAPRPTRRSRPRPAASSQSCNPSAAAGPSVPPASPSGVATQVVAVDQDAAPPIPRRGESPGASKPAIRVGERWLTAGAGRRGRGALHWSARRRRS